MTRRWRPAVLGGATVVVLAVGGSLAAFANWSAGSSATTVRVTAARVPVMAKPRADLLLGRPVVRWDRVQVVPGRFAQRYLVTRHVNGRATVVCDVPGTRALCVDLLAPILRPSAYSVHATYEKWIGPESPTSAAVSVLAGVAPPSPAQVAAVTAAATVPAQALVAAPPETPAETPAGTPAAGPEVPPTPTDEPEQVPSETTTEPEPSPDGDTTPPATEPGATEAGTVSNPVP